MFRILEHPSERMLALLADRDLPARRLARIERHLSTCDDCSRRLRDIQLGLQHARRALLGPAEPPHVPAAEARARLRMRLSDVRAAEPAFGSQLIRRGGFQPRWVVAVALLFAVFVVSRSPDGPNEVSGGELSVFLLPQQNLTPGATRAVSVREVCDGHRPVRVQPVPASVHERVFRAYGADYGRADDYELDRLITPELGGTHDEANLWPQAFGSTAWNAYVKDELEQLFHQQICEGRLDFATAQREIATDWIAAYKRHFNTDTPRRDYRTSPLTSLDRELIVSELREAGLDAWHLTVGVSPHNE